MKRNTIRTKILLIYLLCIFIPLLLTNLWFYISLERVASERELTILDQSLNQTVIHIRDYLDRSVEISDAIFYNGTLSLTLSRAYEQPEEFILEMIAFRLNGFLDSLRSTYSVIDEITIHSTNATIVSGGSVNRDPAFLDMPWYDSLTQASPQPWIVQPGEEQDGLRLYRRLWTVEGSSTSALEMKLSLNELESILADAPHGSALTLIGTSGIIAEWGDKPDSRKVITIEKDISIKEQGIEWTLTAEFPEDSVMPDTREIISQVAVIYILSILVATIVASLIASPMEKRLRGLAAHINAMEEMGQLIPYDQDRGKDEIGVTIAEFNMLISRIRQLIEDVYEKELQKKQAQLNAYQTNINPHFLYNTLNTIKMKCLIKKEKETSDIIGTLSSLFRDITEWSETTIPLEKELAFIENYLTIQRYRFDDRFAYTVKTAPVLLSCPIPKMSLQPLIENACLHGLEKKKGRGSLDLAITDDGGKRMRIEIKDDGVGIPLEKLEKIKEELNEPERGSSNIGIRNVYMRLSHIYGDTLMFDIMSDPEEGTRITIGLPLEESL